MQLQLMQTCYQGSSDSYLPAQNHPPVIEYGAAWIKLPCDSLRDKRVTLCIRVLLWVHRRVNLKGVPLYTDVTSVYSASHAVARSKYQRLESSSFLDHLLSVAFSSGPLEDPRETCRRRHRCVSTDLLSLLYRSTEDFISYDVVALLRSVYTW